MLWLENSWGGKGLLGRNRGSRRGFLKRGRRLGLGLEGLGEELGEAGSGVGVEGAGDFGIRIVENVLAWLGFE